MDDIDTAGDTDLFCKNCHDVSYPHTQWSTNMSGKGFACVECHVMVPHGSPVSRLIGYQNFIAPYNLNGNTLKLDGWRKRPYDIADLGLQSAAYSTNGSCSSGMGVGCHSTDAGGYDPFPLP